MNGLRQSFLRLELKKKVNFGPLFCFISSFLCLGRFSSKWIFLYLKHTVWPNGNLVNFNILPFSAMRICQIAHKIGQSKLKTLANTNWTLSKWPKYFNVVVKWRNFAKSGHTVKPYPSDGIWSAIISANQCDQIWRFIGLWATFKCFWQHLICTNLSHS